MLLLIESLPLRRGRLLEHRTLLRGYPSPNLALSVSQLLTQPLQLCTGPGFLSEAGFGNLNESTAQNTQAFSVS